MSCGRAPTAYSAAPGAFINQYRRSKQPFAPHGERRVDPQPPASGGGSGRAPALLACSSGVPCLIAPSLSSLQFSLLLQVLRKLEASLAAGQFYEAHEMFKTVYHRHRARGQAEQSYQLAQVGLG